MKGCALKKTLFALEQARSDVARRRRRWRSWQAGLDPRHLLFIEETWIKTNMAPLRGWGPRGGAGAGLCAAQSLANVDLPPVLCVATVSALCVFDGPINGDCFRAYASIKI